MRTRTSLLAASACMLLAAHSPAAIIRVRAGAPVGGDGSSWAAAHNSLQAALTASAAGDEIWVASGTYSATTGLYAFAIKSNIALYGGFAGTESSRSQRDVAANITTLSGSNQRTVMAFFDVTGAVLDGFDVVQGLGHGDALTPYDPTWNRCPGGGLLFQNSTVVVSNCRMTDNRGGQAITSVPYSNGDGGGAILLSSSVQFSHCEFARNRVGNAALAGCQAGNYTYYGGAGSGAGIAASESAVQLNDCLFIDNVASSGKNGGVCANIRASPGLPGGSGGAVFITGGSLTIDRCRFLGNHAGRGGRGVFWPQDCWSVSGVSGDGGAIACNAPLQVRNSLFVANSTSSNLQSTFCGVDSGGKGSAIHCVGLAQLSNCTFYANQALDNNSASVGALSLNNPQIANCVFWANSNNAGASLDAQLGLPLSSVVLNHSIVQSLEPLTHSNRNTDPLFIDPDGLNNILGDADDRFDLAWNSPAIDAGLNAAIAGFPHDLAGNARFFDVAQIPDSGTDTAPIVDIGPYEFFRCPVDLSSAATPGQPDNAVTIDDLLYFLTSFEAGTNPADLDNGAATGVHDNAVTIDDLLFFLVHFEAGC